MLCLDCGTETKNADHCPECGQIFDAGLPVDRFIDGRYYIEEFLEYSKTTPLYLANDTRMDKKTAVRRIICSEKKEPDTYFVPLVKRAESLMKASCEGIPQITDVISENGSLYIIQSLVKGKRVSVSAGSPDSPKSESEAIDFLLAGLDVLQNLHEVNPPIYAGKFDEKNVIINGRDKVYITGLELHPDGDGSPADDFYYLGRVLYYLLTNKKYEPGKVNLPANEINLQISEKTSEIIVKMTAENPDERPESIREIYKMIYGGQMPEVNRFIYTNVLIGIFTFFLIIAVLWYLFSGLR